MCAERSCWGESTDQTRLSRAELEPVSAKPHKPEQQPDGCNLEYMFSGSWVRIPLCLTKLVKRQLVVDVIILMNLQ